VIDEINATGFGLTFGLHTRIDDRVQQVVDRIRAGNVYVNRNQIGAIVGSQPFGGEGLSGTGPKAGGPQAAPRSPWRRASRPKRGSTASSRPTALPPCRASPLSPGGAERPKPAPCEWRSPAAPTRSCP
jgi:RHH-type proline utilization regulon transcriptional repressor/proline dehydrogenase/delta 1-pyrroline-5-carboxylate dehydrogenase